MLTGWENTIGEHRISTCFVQEILGFSGTLVSEEDLQEWHRYTFSGKQWRVWLGHCSIWKYVFCRHDWQHGIYMINLHYYIVWFVAFHLEIETDNLAINSTISSFFLIRPCQQCYAVVLCLTMWVFPLMAIFINGLIIF